MRQMHSFPVLVGLIVAILLTACQPGQRIFLGLATPAPTAVPDLPPTPTPTPTPSPTPPPFSLRTSENYLLLGTDRRPDWNSWRTDTIMVIGLDRTHQRAAVLSIPRDLYVEIPEYGASRINQADYVGERRSAGSGPNLVSEVISATLGIQTKHWLRFDLGGFKSLVDALGGITVHLDCPFYELVYDLDQEQYVYYTLPAGDVLLDGEDAYFFVTLRYVESDFGRSRRQRQLLWALRNQALDSGLIARVPVLWNAFQDSFTTDLSILQALDLAGVALSLKPENVRATAIANDELERYITASGADVMRIADPERIQALLDNIWSAPSLADTNRRDPDACPPPPVGVPAYLLEMPVENSTPVAPAQTGDSNGGAPGG